MMFSPVLNQELLIAVSQVNPADAMPDDTDAPAYRERALARDHP
jgi:hypothetical protein